MNENNPSLIVKLFLYLSSPNLGLDILAFGVILALVSLLAFSPMQFEEERFLATMITTDATPSLPPSPPAEPTQSPLQESVLPAPIRDDQKIPILMYHYIRNYKKRRDKIGTNLSVSREVLANQLRTLRAVGYTSITFTDLEKPLPEKPIIITFDDGYDNAYGDAFPLLKEQGMKGVFFIVTDYIGKSRYMTEEQIKILTDEGMEIGAHTVHHSDLTKLGKAEQWLELTESKKRLEALTGKAVTAFCYPAGQHNATTLALVKEAGFTIATTTKEGIMIGKELKEKSYELERLRVTNDTDLLKELSHD